MQGLRYSSPSLKNQSHLNLALSPTSDIERNCRNSLATMTDEGPETKSNPFEYRFSTADIWSSQG